MCRRISFLLLLAVSSMLYAGIVSAQGLPPADKALARIAFGSCARESAPQPIWDAIVARKPDLFVFTGDNIYGDTDDMSVMRAKYDLLGQQPGFKALRATCPVLATWDDHDYGKNDAGTEYAQKEASQQEFLRFFQEPASSPRWTRPGVYHAYTFGPEGKRVQIILLDTRYFRSPLRKAPAGSDTKFGSYAPVMDEDATVLGDEQWQWLEQQLRQPAELRIVVSSIQLVPEDHHYELWANFPRERQRFFELVRRTGAQGVVVISGDRHMAEISRLDPGDPNGVGYPLYDVTASGLNRFGGGKPDEPNRHRVSQGIYQPVNFGLITVDWNQPDPRIVLEVRDIDGKVVFDQSASLSQLCRN